MPGRLHRDSPVFYVLKGRDVLCVLDESDVLAGPFKGAFELLVADFALAEQTGLDIDPINIVQNVYTGGLDQSSEFIQTLIVRSDDGESDISGLVGSKASAESAELGIDLTAVKGEKDDSFALGLIRGRNLVGFELVLAGNLFGDGLSVSALGSCIIERLELHFDLPLT